MMKKRRKWSRPVKPDYDRKVFTVLRMIKQSGKKDSEIAKECFVSSSTIRNWRRGYQNGGTRYGSSICLDAVARVCGFESVYVDNVQNLGKAERFDDDRPLPEMSKKSPPKKATKKPKMRRAAKRADPAPQIDPGQLLTDQA